MLKRINTSNQDLRLIQDNVDAELSPLQAGALTGGNVVTSTLASGQDNLIAHKLGRTPKYWLVIGIDASATVYEKTSVTLGNASKNSLFINLWCSANCGITLWVA